ncbi:MAG: DUF1835 domain-containing protein, partial [Chitinophagaceae bacterium]
MIHVVFNEADQQLMARVLEQEDSLAGDIKLIRDDFAVGPVADLDTEEGWNGRVEWWRNLLAGSPYGQQLAGSFDDRLTVQEITGALDGHPDEQVWIWMAQNQHDVTGYYWLIAQLKDYQGRVMVLYMNNLPFFNEKSQLFYPTWLSEIPVSEFRKAKKLDRMVTLSEFELDGDEWKRLSAENAMVRQLEGGKKLAGHDISFYDNELLKNITGDWQKSWRVLSNTLNRMKVKTGDVFIMGRMKELISSGSIEVSGDPEKGWKDFDVKLPSKVPQEAGT